MGMYISEKIKKMNEDLETGLNRLDIEYLESAKIPLEQLRNHIRESIQGNLSGPVKELVKKLKRDQDLTSDDLDIIKKWMVGDASYYTEIENNFQDWVKECKRLIGILNGYATRDFAEDQTTFFKINALLIDLEFTLDDVIHYVYFSNRVKRFRESVSQGKISYDDKKALAELIERQLYSEDF